MLADDEKDFWKPVKSELMSDEDPASDGDEIIIKTPAWRAELLNELIKTLDKRVEENFVFKRMIKKKRRQVVAPSNRSRPLAEYSSGYVLSERA